MISLLRVGRASPAPFPAEIAALDFSGDPFHFIASGQINCPCAYAATRRRPGEAGSRGCRVPGRGMNVVYRRRISQGPASSSRSELDAPSTNLKLEIDSTVQSPRGSRRLPPSARHWLHFGRFLVLFVARNKKYDLPPRAVMHGRYRAYKWDRPKTALNL